MCDCCLTAEPNEGGQRRYVHMSSARIFILEGALRRSGGAAARQQRDEEEATLDESIVCFVFAYLDSSKWAANPLMSSGSLISHLQTSWLLTSFFGGRSPHCKATFLALCLRARQKRTLYLFLMMVIYDWLDFISFFALQRFQIQKRQSSRVKTKRDIEHWKKVGNEIFCLHLDFTSVTRHLFLKIAKIRMLWIVYCFTFNLMKVAMSGN